MMRAADALDLSAGLLVANPIPQEHEIPHERIDAIIEQAVAEADEQGVKGKDSTPFLLSRIVALTEGASLTTNIQLVYNNARLGAAIAAAYTAQ